MQVVGAFLDIGAQLAQFAGHGGDAVGFLDAPAGDVAQGAGAVGIKRHHGQGHGRVGNVVAIQVNRLERPGAAAYGQAVGAALDLGAHLPGRIDKPDVALDGGFAKPAISMPFWPVARRYCAKRYEITSG